MSKNSEKYEQLVSYGDQTFELGNREESTEFYEEAYKIKKSGRIAFSIFVWYVSQSDYGAAREWLLELGKFKKFKNDFYTYALLLNNFIQLPDELIQELSNLDFDDIRLQSRDYRFVDRSWNNKIREDILSGKYRSAYKTTKRIIARGNVEPQEYVIYRLLREKVVKEPKRIKQMVEEERFDDLYDFLNTKPNYQKHDEIAMRLLQDIYVLLDGIIIEKNNKNAVTFSDAIYNADYDTAIKLCKNNVAFDSLLKKVTELNQINWVNKFKGDLGYYFDDNCYRIYDALKNEDYDSVKTIIKEYISEIGKVEYNNYLIGMVDVYRLMPEYQGDLLNLLHDVTYGYRVIDTRYLKKLFGVALNEHKYDVAESLLQVFKYMIIKTDINIDYMEFVYNRELYLNEKVPYDTQEEDDLLTARLNELIEEQNEDSQIKTITANNQHEEFVIKYNLKNINSSFYKMGSVDYPVVFYIKKQQYKKKFKKDYAVTKINDQINSGNYESALETIKVNIAYSQDFDYVLLSYVAYIYDLMGNTDRLEIINSILLNVYNIEDYHVIINSDEVALLDNSNNYVDFVKKLINKPVE